MYKSALLIISLFALATYIYMNKKVNMNTDWQCIVERKCKQEFKFAMQVNEKRN